MTELEQPRIGYLMIVVRDAAAAEPALGGWSERLAQLGATEITTTIEGNDVFFCFWAEPDIEIPDDLFVYEHDPASREFDFEVAPAG